MRDRFPCSHIEVTPEHNGNLFFWHFQNKHIANKQRTVIWLNGGPGCSSMDGALMEVGPYRLKDANTLVYNEGSWSEFANLMFVDNPVGTGFSYVNTDSYVTELDQMADQFVEFLEKWFALFPEYQNDDVRRRQLALFPVPARQTLAVIRRYLLTSNLGLVSSTSLENHTLDSISHTSRNTSRTGTRTRCRGRNGI